MLTEKHHDLGRCLGQFAAEEHQYRDTLKAISQESQKYKQLMAQLNAWKKKNQYLFKRIGYL